MRVLFVFVLALVQVMSIYGRTPGDVIQDFLPVVNDFHQKIGGIENYAHSAANSQQRYLETTMSGLSTIARNTQMHKIAEINEQVNETIENSGYTREQVKYCLDRNEILVNELIGDVHGGVKLTQSLVSENITYIYYKINQIYAKLGVLHKTVQGSLDICGAGAETAEPTFRCLLDQLYLTNLPEINVVQQETSDGFASISTIITAALKNFSLNIEVIIQNIEKDKINILNNFDSCIRNLTP